MQENEFEKRVQEEMEEFRLRPSEAVWEKVEVQLKKKKRRRVIFFISMLAGLSLLGYSGYFLTKTNLNQHLVQADKNSLPDSDASEKVDTHPESPATETTIVKDQPSIKDRQLSPSKEKDKDNNAVIVLENDKVTPVGNEILNQHKQTTRKFASDKPAFAKPAGKKKSDIITENFQLTDREKNGSNQFLNAPADKKEFSQQSVAKNNLQDDSKLTEDKKDDNITNQKIDLPTKADSAIAADSKVEEIMAATKQQQRGKKIKLGIDLSVGVSSSQNKAFSLFDMQKSADMQSNSPTNSNGGGFGIPPRTYPSDVKPGAAFRAGVVAEMKLSTRSSIVSGLQYLYHSTNINVGVYKDTTVLVTNSFSQDARVEAVYRGTHQKDYTNRFHFIQVPLQYQLQLNKGLKTPIVWSVGVSAGYLLATNGLVYDTAAYGIYYRDNDAFNKFRFNVNTGLSFRFGTKSKVQWSIGPEFSMGMNRLMKDDYTKKQYLLYSGLTGRLFFQKRNR